MVYKARDTRLDRFVAIKVPPPERVASLDRKSRFVQEARSASALNHPNIITIYDTSAHSGRDCIAMEHVSAKTLDQLIPRKGMRLNDALKIAVQIADALSRAHAAGIKPQTEEGMIVGSVAYMSPERADGTKLGVRANIFPFGSVLYETVTGRWRFYRRSSPRRPCLRGGSIRKRPRNWSGPSARTPAPRPKECRKSRCQ